ncbi:cell division protein FtsB [Taylorella equigenitalis]|uniref:Cell division protein FtsB n=3 Tax=Taylorella equigenitalis TaxID=29575 RepID=A0A654KF00_TAYEM|nr:cell division protein FtsB [Taylorella equigenitalis]ADU90969.1 Cell division protein FtsB [Taylorella equigenitalis MCE9]AFN36076.1 septum formation initiator [Taylorella equigenitalis ATCC 35865]ASY30713.1 cell division protein FtsB [Taylorella equigenitalis]ASY38012.1 cell division protein FtsB [Taylorella equigenitalis]ASY39490.1 cell division protein FtsB [Taylorella equigenitalis]
MRRLILVLIFACIAIQYPLYFGSKGYKRVEELKEQLQNEKDKSAAMTARNNAMQAEIEDLSTGTEAIEDIARQEMNMISKDQIFVRVVEPTKSNVQKPNLNSQTEVPHNNPKKDKGAKQDR